LIGTRFGSFRLNYFMPCEAEYNVVWKSVFATLVPDATKTMLYPTKWLRRQALHDK